MFVFTEYAAGFYLPFGPILAKTYSLCWHEIPEEIFSTEKVEKGDLVEVEDQPSLSDVSDTQLKCETNTLRTLVVVILFRMPE